MQIIKTSDLEAVIKQPQIESLIIDKMGRAQFLESATLLFKGPEYQNCTTQSVLGALLKCATVGLRFTKELGEAWAIPRNVKTGRKITNAQGKEVDEYETVCQFQIGYKGWMRLAEDTGRVSHWDYGVVWESDEFDFEQGTAQYLKHKAFKGQNRGRKTHFWAMAFLTDGKAAFHVVTMDEVEQYRRFSETQYNWANGQKQMSATPKGIWATSYDAMALRLPIKEIATKKVPKSGAITAAIAADESVVRIDETTGEVIEQGAAEIRDAVEVQLHDDYVDEVQMCKTKAQVRQVYEQRKAEINPELRGQYLELCTKHGQSLDS